MAKYIAAVAFLLCCSLFAAQPIAVLTAGSNVTINGKPVQTTGAPNWPLAAGDEVITGPAGTAHLTFTDGTCVHLKPNTKVVIRTCDRCVVRLDQGAIDYTKPGGATVEFCALGHPIRPPQGTEGNITIETAPEKQVVWKSAAQEQVVSSGKCPCNIGGIPVGKIMIVSAIATAVGVAAVDVTRPDRRSSPQQ